MANNYFQFKQFTIHQDKCAMKVCTDACLFGAYTSSQINKYFLQINNCLDIGAGTGLLSLMAAQKLNIPHFDAIEIDAQAYQQAKENILQSPWNKKINIINQDIVTYNTDKKYELIICNPPFYSNDLHSPNEQKNAAMHSTTLSIEKLIDCTNNYITPTGIFAVLLPYHRANYFTNEANKYDFFLVENVFVKQTVHHNFFRSILFLSKNKTTLMQNEISIKDAEGSYTTAFKNLLREYYLHL